MEPCVIGLLVRFMEPCVIGLLVRFMEPCQSGLTYLFAKEAGCQSPREFESPRFRQEDKVRTLYY